MIIQHDELVLSGVFIVVIAFAVQTCRLAYYKGYYDQKQRNKKIVEEVLKGVAK